MAFIPKPQFPNVPKLPGVPQLVRSLQFPAGPPPIVGAAIALGRLWQSLFTQPLWAIYKQAEEQPTETDEGVETVTVVADRTPVVVPDSFLAFSYRNEYSVSDYPVQRGAFMSYNKVANPFEAAVRLSKGGSLQERKAFLESLDAIVGTLDLYDILTPEKTYIGVNVLRWELARQGVKGAYFFAEVDVYFREIRQSVSTYTTSSADTANAQSTSALPVQNIGTVPAQATTVTPESAGIVSEGP
jgi:hypothetical protein